MDQNNQTPVINESANQPKEELQIQSEGGLVKSFDSQGGKNMRPKNLKIVFAVFVMVVLGVVSGYGLSLQTGKGSNLKDGASEMAEGDIKKGLIVGSKDKDTFKDVAEGELAKGGIDGEGSHHLVRPGGDSQNVYLTSSLIDLDLYTGRKIKVWGETFSAQQAGWLMDVGKLEVLE